MEHQPGQATPMRKPKNEERPDPNARIAYQLLSADPHAEDTRDIHQVYADSDRSDDIQSYELNLKGDRANIFYASELLIGRKDADVNFYLNAVDRVRQLSEEEKPHLVVLSGLLQGDFKFAEKARRETLAPGLESMNKQFQLARDMIEEAATIGAPVVYNMSNDDKRIAREYTVEVFRRMSKLARSHAKAAGSVDEADTNLSSWHIENTAMTNPNWTTHLRFQTDVVFPYCLRAGRRLYSAEEMAELTKDWKVPIDQDEYFLLFDMEKRATDGKRLNNSQYRWLREVNATRNNDIVITDDVDLEINTKGRHYTDWIRHHLNPSDKPMYANFMATPISVVASRAANGVVVPDMLVTQHNQEAVGAGGGHGWIMDTGGMTRASRHIRSSGSRVSADGDISKRLVRSRRRVSSPTATVHSRTDDGRYQVTFMNDVLYEKSFSIPERMTIAEICDLQVGSISARPDLTVKYLDYIRSRVMGERPTALFFGGDLIQGRNFGSFAQQEQATGLMSIDSQNEFLAEILRGAMADGATKEELGALLQIIIEPGNHEWNSDRKQVNGTSFVNEARHVFERMLARGGYTDDEISNIVKTHTALFTQQGDYMQSYTAVGYFGEIGVLLQHYLLDRGAKNTSGGLPIYQAQGFINGAGSLAKNIDIVMAGHWHSPQYGVFGDKLGIVGGSIANITSYELWRGLKATIAGTLVHIGGGQPTAVEFISKDALLRHKVERGRFTDESLKDRGFEDDADFDPYKHGIYLPEAHFPKSALQKYVLSLQRNFSQRTNGLAELR